MLTKHSITYFLGRGLPGIINFAALSIYTRFVLPEEYGNYALVVTTVNLFNAVFFQWIRLVLLRFSPTCISASDKARLNTTVVLGYGASVAASVLVLSIVLYITENTISAGYIYVGIGLLVAQALFEIGLDYYRSSLQPKQYALAHFFKSVLAVLLGSTLVYAGFGAYGLLSSVLIALIVAMAFYFRRFIHDLYTGIQPVDWQLVRKHLLYGVPLTASSALSFIMDSSDRYLINYYLGDASTGVYAVGYDLAKQTLWVIMTSISLASYPLVIRALEQEGAMAADKYLKSNLILLLAISLPAAIGMSVLAPQLANLLVGHQYADTVAALIPYVAIGGLLSGLKSFYFDQSFQLARKTHLQLWSVGAAAVLNVGMNVILLPRIGLMGAAYSTLLSYAIVLLVSYALSKQAYQLPVPWQKVGKILFASVAMGTIIILVKPYCPGLWGLVFLISSGSIVYGSLLVLLNIVSGTVLIHRLKSRSKLKHYA